MKRSDLLRQTFQQRRSAAIEQCSGTAISSFTPEGIIESWNAGAEGLYGYSEAEVLGESITMLIPSELQTEAHADLGRLAAGENVDARETCRLRRDGQEIHLWVSASAIRDAAGHIIAISEFAHPVVAGEQRRQPFSVEPGDQLGDSIAGAAAGGAGGRGKARAVGHRQERGRPRHAVGPFAGGARHLC